MNTAPELSLYDALLQSGRLSADQRAEVERLFAELSADPVKLADELLARKLITRYMHRKIQTGKPGELVFGQYLILERIGEGGMGKVYRAIETRLGREVALKTIRPNLLANRTVVQRYKREARAAAALKHPNIVELYEADDVGGRYFLAMEFVDGSDLSRLVKDLTKDKVVIPPGEAAEYIRQAALGVQHAHDKGLVHRDIKPSNLLVSGDRAIPGTNGMASVKILDMGLVRSLADDDASTTDLTRDGTVVGTPDYMSPEQSRNSSTVDHRADIYSLGCTLFFLLRGSPPYDSGTAIDKLIKHQLDPVPDIRQYRPDVPPGLAAVIKKMMAKKPDERYQTATEVSRELAAYTGDAAFNFTAAPAFQAVDLSPTGSAATPTPARTPAADATPAVATPTAATTSRTVRVISRPPAQPGTPPTGGPRAGKPPGSLRARPIAKRPADATPSGDVDRPNPATASGRRKADVTPTSSSTRRPPLRRPPPKKAKGGFPVVAAAVGGVVLVAFIVVLAVLVAFANRPAPPPTTTAEQKPPPQPVAKSPYRPAAELLPDDTAAVLVADPKAHWERVGFLEPTSRVRRNAEALFGWFKFDLRKFDRVTVAFQPDMTRCVAAGEGDVLAGDRLRKELDAVWWLTADTDPQGVTLVRQKRDPKNPFNADKPPVRAELLPDKPAHLIGSSGLDLADVYKNPATRTGPTAADPLVLAAADAAGDTADTPLLFFAAGGGCRLPLKSAGTPDPLRAYGVDLLTLTAAPAPDGKRVKLTLTALGPDAHKLDRFLGTDLPAALDALAGRTLADPIRAAATDLTPTDAANGRKQLTAEFTWDWSAVHAAADKLLPLPRER
jgi:serine/threonine-protein kinase